MASSIPSGSTAKPGIRYITRSVRKREMELLSSDDVNGPTTKRKKLEPEGEEILGRKRREIHPVLEYSELHSKTQQALKEEKERVERLKMCRIQEDQNDERLILERDSKSKEIKIEVRQSLVPSIKPHQRDGIKFLYEACVEKLSKLRSGHGMGAILAHCMGLGKTLQVIAFADALLTCNESTVKKALVLCPVNTVNNWKKEFHKWISSTECDYGVYLLSETSVEGRIKALREWYEKGGIIFVGYEMFRNLALSKYTKRAKDKSDFRKFLLDPGADMVVCDEGHVLRNSKSSLSEVVNQVQTRFRVVLTGTPLQNNLLEYYTMVNFVKPNLLGLPMEFTNQFVHPIINGQCLDSTPWDIRRMKHRAHILHSLLKDVVQRRDFRILANALPPKKEYVLNVRFSALQDQLYRKYLRDNNLGSRPTYFRGRRRNGTKGGRCQYEASDLFSAFSNLMKVWNHPWVLDLDYQRRKKKAEREAEQTDEQEDGESSASNSETEDSTSASSSKKTNAFSFPPPWYKDVLPKECEHQLDFSGKYLFLFELLEQTKMLDEKILVFSQSLLTLDLLELFLAKPEFGGWVPNKDYCRLDGSTSASARIASMSEFNKDGNERLRLFLISTRAGSLGINLVAANRVVIFDACWNPSHDLQAVFRAYRYGQTKPVFVYRLLAQGTMEEKIYDRQVTKQSLSMRVVDEKQIGRHYSSSDLAELFAYTPPPPLPIPDDGPAAREPPSQPEEDIILCKVLDKLQPSWVISYHEHDSLLEHIDDEELSTEERKAAWENYSYKTRDNSAKGNQGSK